MREHTFEMPGEARLKVQVGAGEVEVETHAGPEALVRLSPIADDDAGREAVERAKVELHGDELVVQARDKLLSFGGTPEIRVEIRCPEGTHTRIHSGSADIRVRGRLGDTNVHVASGDVELGGVDGRLDVHSASGDLRVDSVRDDARLHSASGELELAHSDAAVEARTASGDVTLGDAGGGPVRVHSASGDVRVGVRAGRRVAVDVRTVSGDASSEIPLDEPAGGNEDGPLVDITVNGVSGDVRIERAAPTSALVEPGQR
jgi:Putative adhesin